MKIAKRIIVFTLVNILVVLSISALISILGVQPYMDAKGLNYSTLAVFCLLWGGGGALVSLAFSRIMAKWMMGVKVIDPHRASPEELEIVARVHRLARKAGISTMPEVGIYESGELNAFATGPTRNRALVAVSRGLLLEMNRSELEGVLAHEVAHISNGDMVTMTLVQGVVNAFVMFFARVVAWFAAQFVEEEKGPIVKFGVTFVLEICLGLLGMLVVAAVSRRREFQADEDGARLSSPREMISALKALKKNSLLPIEEEAEPALASLKIFGKGGGWSHLFSTHPDLEVRVAKLEQRFVLGSLAGLHYQR